MKTEHATVNILCLTIFLFYNSQKHNYYFQDFSGTIAFDKILDKSSHPPPQHLEHHMVGQKGNKMCWFESNLLNSTVPISDILECRTGLSGIIIHLTSLKLIIITYMFR